MLEMGCPADYVAAELVAGDEIDWLKSLINHGLFDPHESDAHARFARIIMVLAAQTARKAGLSLGDAKAALFQAWEMIERVDEAARRRQMEDHT